MKKRVGILISAAGSNMRALIAAAADPSYPAEIVLVISNDPNAGGLAHAAADGIPTKVIPHQSYGSREAFDRALDAALREARVDIVCLAGFKRIHSSWFPLQWEGQLINIHPALLPSFQNLYGLKAHKAVLDAGVRVSGCTVHFVAPEVDTGAIIAQTAVPVAINDTPETLSARVIIEENRLYPIALKALAEGSVRLNNGKAEFRILPS